VQERIEALGFGTSGSRTPQTPSSRPSLDPHSQSHATTAHAGGGADQAAAAAAAVVVVSLQEQKPTRPHPPPRPEDVWEIVCNDTVLPPNVTLAVVRQYIWRQSGEVVLHYRCKWTPAAAAAAAATTTTTEKD